MNTPITNEIMDLFRKWGIDPDRHMCLVSELMRFVYDEKIEAIYDASGKRPGRQAETGHRLATAIDHAGTDPATEKEGT